MQARNVCMHTQRVAGRPRMRSCHATSQAAPSTSRPAGPAGLKGLKFAKYHGIGNDFILIDNRHTSEPVITPEQAVKLCNRNFGIGADGVIFALPPVGNTNYTMRIYNSDGSEPEMCGNGIRCLARFVADVDKVELEDGQSKKYNVHTNAGLIVPELLPNGGVRVDMGQPILAGPRIPTTLEPTEGTHVVQRDLVVDGRTLSFTCVSMGNPHAVTYTIDGKPIKVDELDLARLGPLCEKHSVFPARTNTEFVEVINRGHVRMVVWERGAGPTLACGTGACATVVAGVLEGRLDDFVRVDLPGGPLYIDWSNHGKVYMSGPAEHVYSGFVTADML